VLLFICLPGMLHARREAGVANPDSGARIYTIHLSISKPPVKIELPAIQNSAEWEVTAAYDSALCEIHCFFRRKRDAWGRTPLASLLLPPIASIRIYTNFVSQPATVIVDPAGAGLPCAARDTPLTWDAIFIPARRVFVTVPAHRHAYAAPDSPETHFFSSTNQPEVTSSASQPLRI
jgi:hypothetical protein